MIKRLLFSSNTHDSVTSAALLVLRLAFAGILIPHGWGKLTNFEATVLKFESMGIENSLAAGLVVFAEVFCAAGVITGLLYRLALIPLIINMSVAFFFAHGGKLVGEGNGELAFLYLVVFVILMLTGPGKYALDDFIGRKLRSTTH